MEKKEAEEIPCCSGTNSRASLSLPASRGLYGLGLGCIPCPTAPRRLPSLRNRDLTLGGALKKTKKTFEPNVNAVRKSKDELKEEIQVMPKRERKQRDAKRRETRSRRKEKPQTIQSHSIFEQGPADTPRKTGCWGASAQVCDTTKSPIKPIKPIKEEPQDYDDDEDELLRILQRDDFICDPSLKNDAKLKPIQLPLCQTSTSSQEKRLLEAPSSGFKTEYNGEQPSLVEILHGLCLSGEEELFFMQLPDCMPVRAQKTEPTFEKAKEKKPLHEKAQESPSVKSSPGLAEFPEGFLGKLQIRKSGKVEMKLGDIVMDITNGSALSFLQQLVSVNLSGSKTGDMMVLGNIKHKLVVSPNFQTLLEQLPQQQQGS